jgi:hypothetical protein
MKVSCSNFQANVNYPINTDTEPDTCPRCHRSIHPKLLGAYAHPEKHICQLTYRCANLSCQEVFIANYATPLLRRDSETAGVLLSTVPLSALPSNFPETITECSPVFVQIYDQAIAAESHGLDQMVGIGMRKALEFLIKDYSCLEHPDKEEEIKKSLLGNCIKDFILDSNVKACAKRAAWLGNDETHYVRKWTDQDISDLKMLIKLTVNWIDNALTTKKYLSTMPD